MNEEQLTAKYIKNHNNFPRQVVLGECCKILKKRFFCWNINVKASEMTSRIKAASYDYYLNTPTPPPTAERLAEIRANAEAIRVRDEANERYRLEQLKMVIRPIYNEKKKTIFAEYFQMRSGSVIAYEHELLEWKDTKNAIGLYNDVSNLIVEFSEEKPTMYKISKPIVYPFEQWVMRVVRNYNGGTWGARLTDGSYLSGYGNPYCGISIEQVAEKVPITSRGTGIMIGEDKDNIEELFGDYIPQ